MQKNAMLSSSESDMNAHILASLTYVSVRRKKRTLSIIWLGSLSVRPSQIVNSTRVFLPSSPPPIRDNTDSIIIHSSSSSSGGADDNSSTYNVHVYMVSAFTRCKLSDSSLSLPPWSSSASSSWSPSSKQSEQKKERRRKSRLTFLRAHCFP